MYSKSTLKIEYTVGLGLFKPRPPKSDYNKVIYEADFEEIFIGTDKSKIYGNYWWATGNSILVKLSKNKYVFIGSVISEFNTKEEIQEYYSEVGNSSVSYPYAIGKKYTYLMIEPVKMLNSKINFKKEQPYDKYYENENGSYISDFKMADANPAP